ncbi:methyltransferase [Aureococcus anophagefferens]|nr:methyltransferase [Aureococcus anophagefferens]
MTLNRFDVLLPVGAHVDFLYVDAQGHGLKILEGAGDWRASTLIVVERSCGRGAMYETQNGCAATVEFAAAAGFHVPFETRAFLCDHVADHAAA